MDGGVAPSTVTATPFQKFSRCEAGMRHIADRNHPGGGLHLGMAFETEVVVALGQQLRVDRSVHAVTSCATLAQRFVLEHVGLGLLPVTLRALRIDARHKRTFGRVNIRAMRIVAGGAAHPSFRHRMMELQVKFRLLFEVALEAGFRLFLRIDNKLAPPAAGIHMQTPGAVTRFASPRKTDPLPFAGNFQP